MIAMLTVGCSGSGKSTFAKEFIKYNPDYVEINRDNIRFDTFCNGIHDWSLYKFSRENEDIVTAVQHIDIVKAFENQKNVIISDTNLSTIHRNKLQMLLIEEGFDHVQIKVFDVPYEELVRRNNSRGKLSIPEDVLLRQFNNFQELINEY